MLSGGVSVELCNILLVYLVKKICESLFILIFIQNKYGKVLCIIIFIDF